MMERTNTGHCRRCGAALLWARDEDGRRLAIDPEPSADGELILVKTERGKLLAFVDRWRIGRRKDGYSGNGYYGYPYDGSGGEEFGRYVPHSVICPSNAEWKQG